MHRQVAADEDRVASEVLGPPSCRAETQRLVKLSGLGEIARRENRDRDTWFQCCLPEGGNSPMCVLAATFRTGQREPRFTASAFHRAMTSLYCALALATASSSLVVGATSAACIAIAAPIIAAPTLTRVGGPPAA